MRKRKLIYGVGVNDADYVVAWRDKVTGKHIQCPYYTCWQNMIQRAYYQRHKDKRPTYQDVAVCEEWHSFMNFRSWMEQQDWQGKQLDKDILVRGNKVYSPETCVFVSSLVNSFMLDCGATKGQYPTGVYFNKASSKLMAYCCNPFNGTREYLGLFLCPQEAHLTWKKRKHELACQLADMQTDQRVAEALRIRYK